LKKSSEFGSAPRALIFTCFGTRNSSETANSRFLRIEGCEKRLNRSGSGFRGHTGNFDGQIEKSERVHSESPEQKPILHHREVKLVREIGDVDGAFI